MPYRVFQSQLSEDIDIKALSDVHRRVLSSLSGQDVSAIALAVYLSQRFKEGITDPEKLYEAAGTAFRR